MLGGKGNTASLPRGRGKVQVPHFASTDRRWEKRSLVRHFFLGCLSEMGWCYHKSFCLFFFFNIYIFGCARSSLWHGGSSMQHVGSLAVPRGIWFPDHGLNLGTPALGARSLSHGPLGKLQGFWLGRLLFPFPSTMKVRLSSRLLLSVPTGKGMTEDEMAGWHHRLDGHVFG